jgi:uncharacterized cupin superfamily protein
VTHAHIPSIAWQEIRSPGGKFHSWCQNISLALGGIRNVGTFGGGHPFDLQVRRIPAGASVCPYHLHVAQWEFFIVRAGAGIVRTPEGSAEIKTGDAFFHPPGTPHQLINSGGDDLVVLIIADNPEVDACYYPGSNKWALRPPGKVFRMNEVDYLDGEEPPVPGAEPYRPAPPASPSRPVAPFAQRRIQIDDLPWDTWTSPKAKFEGASKELSIALGAARNTPTGLGGHPFDVEIGRLRPGKTGCPFHSHAAQWELFLILSGTADVRLESGSHTLREGDVCIHPPTECHQITNASNTGDLTYLLVADNPPVDYWYYPDSKKWGMRVPRQFFRVEPLEYYDGEE